jgi:hypothetical protein
MKPYRINIEDARCGDIIVYKGSGLIYKILSRLIKKIKEPEYDCWGWHMEPVIGQGLTVNAAFPRLKVSQLDPKREMKVYRILANPPELKALEIFVNDHVGKPYDCFVYLWTALWVLGLMKFRIVNRFYTCWENTFDAMEYFGIDLDKSDCKYPFLTDFLRYMGEIK